MEDFILMEEILISTVEDLMNYLHTLPKDMIVCGSDSGFEGIIVCSDFDANCVTFKDNWDESRD